MFNVMLVSEIMIIYCEKKAEDINIPCSQNMKSLILKTVSVL